MKLFNMIQTGDWKGEKHVPVIDAPASVTKGEAFDVTVSVGKEIAHPNKPDHFIAWIQLYFIPEGGKFAIELGRETFDAHGANGEVFTEPSATFKVKLDAPGTLSAVSYCNIHGLWGNEAEIKVQ